MKDEARIISNTLVTYGAKLITAAIGFLMVPYLIRSLGESTYGVMGICWSILGFMLLVEMGLRPALTRQFTDALARGEIARSNQIASSGLVFYLTIGAAIVAALALGGRLFLSRMNVPAGLESEAALTLILVGFSASLTLVGVPFNTVLQSQLRHDVPHYTAVAKSAVTALSIVTIFELWQPRIIVWAIVDNLATLGVLGVFVWQAHRLCPTLQLRSSSVSRRGFGEIASFGAYTTLLGVAGWINLQSGPIVISFFLGTAAVAHFVPILAVVRTLTPLQTAFLAPLRAFLTKAHATGDWSVIRRVLVRSTRYSLLTMGGVLVLLGSLAFHLIPLWLGEGFEDTSQLLLLSCIGWLFQASTGASYGIYIGTGRLRMMTVLNVTLAVVSLGIAIYLVHWSSWGIVGVGWATVTAQTIRGISFFFYSTHLCGIGRARYLREAFLGPALCLVVLAGTSVGVQSVVSALPVVEVLLAAGAASLLYAGVTWRVGLTEEDRVKAVAYLAKAREWVSGRLSSRGVGSSD